MAISCGDKDCISADLRSVEAFVEQDATCFPQSQRCRVEISDGAKPLLPPDSFGLGEASAAIDARFVDLRTRLRTAAVYPGPVFAFDDYVRLGLGRDPQRAGYAGAAAIWAEQQDGDDRLRTKLHTDLLDLAALRSEILEAEVDQVTTEAVEEQAN